MTDEQALRLDERLARIEATLSTHGTKIDTCLLALHHGNITLVALTEQVLALNGRVSSLETLVHHSHQANGPLGPPPTEADSARD